MRHQNIGAWNVVSLANTNIKMDGMFDMTSALSFENKRAIYVGWGAKLRTAYPTWCLVDGNIALAVTAWVKTPTTATTTYGPIADWDVSSVSNMRELFAKKPTFNGDISKWSTASARSFYQTFNGASAFNQNIGAWNVASAANMYQAFNGASAFDRNIGAWNVVSVANMAGLFSAASVFNQNLAAWNVLRATNLTSAFDSTPALSFINKRSLYVAWGATLRLEYPLFCLNDVNIQGAVTSWVTNSTTATMTYGPIADWDVSSVSNMRELFAKTPTFNDDISKWNVASVSTMAGLFSGASTFNADVSKWNVASVSNMVSMFNAASSFDCNVAGWSVADVTSLGSIFNDPIALIPCHKAAIYTGWGSTLRLAHPGFRDAYCDPSKRVTQPSIVLADNAATGMVSRIDVLIDTSALPTGTVLGELQASPSTLFAVPFDASMKAASVNVPTTGNYDAAFTLLSSNGTERCPLPVQNITCMPSFSPSPGGGCECRRGYENVNGTCVATSGCPMLTLARDNSTALGSVSSIITATTSQSSGVKIVAVPKNSTVDVMPGVPTTLPATGEWSISLSVLATTCAPTPRSS